MKWVVNTGRYSIKKVLFLFDKDQKYSRFVWPNVVEKKQRHDAGVREMSLEP